LDARRQAFAESFAESTARVNQRPAAPR